MVFKPFSSKHQYHLAFATLKTLNKFQLINSYVALVIVVLLLSYYSYPWQLWYREGKISKHEVLTFQMIFENKHHLLRGLLIYLSVLQKHPQSSLRIRACSLLERTFTSNWFSNPMCSCGKWMWLQRPWGEIHPQSHCLGGSSSVNCQPVRTPRMKKLEETGDFVLDYQKSDSVGTRASCERSQELLGRLMCGGGWAEVELKTTEWCSLAPTWL